MGTGAGPETKLEEPAWKDGLCRLKLVGGEVYTVSSLTFSTFLSFSFRCPSSSPALRYCPSSHGFALSITKINLNPFDLGLPPISDQQAAFPSHLYSPGHRVYLSQMQQAARYCISPRYPSRRALEAVSPGAGLDALKRKWRIRRAPLRSILKVPMDYLPQIESTTNLFCHCNLRADPPILSRALPVLQRVMNTIIGNLRSSNSLSASFSCTLVILSSLAYIVLTRRRPF